MPVQVNGNTMPTAMAARGTLYDWQDAPIVGFNGRGRVTTAGYPSLNWGWEWLTDAEWDWWVTTVLSGERDALLTGTTQLYNDSKTLKTITSCIVVKPVHRTVVNGAHHGVKLRIYQMVVS